MRAVPSPGSESRLDAGLASLAASHRRAVLVLVGVSLAAFLPGFASLQPMDRDEPRFAQASKQMIETGDVVSIRFQDEARNKKPVGIHWLQAATVAAAERLGVPEARTTIALYRLPSLMGAVAAVLLTYWAGLALAGRREAVLAGLVLATSVLLGAEARLAKTDAVLAACCVAAMGALARAWLGRGRPQPTIVVLVFWVAMALGILVKGPIAPMIVGLAAAVLSVRERSGRWLLGLRPWLGLAILMAVVAPWFIAIAVKTRGGFFADALGHDLLGKVGGGQERHWGPPGAYLVASFGTFWPFAPFAAIAAASLWRDRRDDAVAFCLAWIIPAWVVFEAVPTKLPHYVLPLYPAIAILTARALCRGAIGPRQRGAAAVMLLLPFIPLAVAIGISAATLELDHALPLAALPVLALACLAAIAGWRDFRRALALRAALMGALASVLLSTAIYGLAQPVLRSLKLSPRLAALARAIDCPDPAVASAGYREPSLVFLLGTDLRLTDGAGAAAFLRQGGCRLAFIESRDEGAFSAGAARFGLSPTLAGRVRGFNINGGKRLDIGAYTAGF